MNNDEINIAKTEIHTRKKKICKLFYLRNTFIFRFTKKNVVNNDGKPTYMYLCFIFAILKQLRDKRNN